MRRIARQSKCLAGYETLHRCVLLYSVDSTCKALVLIPPSQLARSGTIATRHACFAAIVTPVIYRYATQSVENQRLRLPRACQIGLEAWQTYQSPSSLLLWFLTECLGLPPAFAFSAGAAAWPPQTQATPTRSAFL